MLAQVVVGAVAGAVFQQQALFVVFPGYDVDHAGDGVAAIKGG